MEHAAHGGDGAVLEAVALARHGHVGVLPMGVAWIASIMERT
jgi:hypothetical protein